MAGQSLAVTPRIEEEESGRPLSRHRELQASAAASQLCCDRNQARFLLVMGVAVAKDVPPEGSGAEANVALKRRPGSQRGAACQRKCKRLVLCQKLMWMQTKQTGGYSNYAGMGTAKIP